MSRLAKALRVVSALVLLGMLGGVVAAAGVYWYLAPKLPSIEVLKDVRLQVPLRVYTRDERLIAEFGEKRRTPLTLQQIPRTMVRAVLAAEDERFFEHPGVDWQGLTRAVIHLVRTGEKGPGGSTITMQVARNFFLGREKTYTRKLNEILLALKIERELTKQDILELYFNKIFLGQRAYGVGAAAHVYYGKELAELDLAQLAMIAGLPKAPSRFNPIVNPRRALARRDYVLGRMHELGFIDDAAFEAARNAGVTARIHGLAVEVEAPYVAEMVRADMETRLGDEAYTGGYEVYTTLDGDLQRAANRALRSALLAYDRRHGYRGPELHVDLADGTDPAEVIADVPTIGGLPPGLVTDVEEKLVTVHIKDRGEAVIPWEGLEWARAYRSENRRGKKPETAGDVVAVGDVVRVRLTEEGWHLAQVPEVEGALVSLDPTDGAVLALTGGFDFFRSKFNRALQAERQPGSSFKPFIYSAALDAGYTPASMINDAPVVFEDPGLEAAWRPENYSGKFFGPTRLREALYKSRNLVSIRLLRAMGVDHAVEHVQRFGFDPARLPRNLSLALGSATVTPLELATGYSVLANGGYRVEPHWIARALDADDAVVFEAEPLRVCRDCERPASGGSGGGAAPPGPAHAGVDPATPSANGSADPVGVPEPEPGSGARGSVAEATADVPEETENVAPRAISAQNAWLMHSLMRDVIQRGTGRRARVLERDDIAGKTGTTNDQRDAWFSGFTPAIVATAWVGFDRLKPLGRRETGSRAALPMWIEYMRVALERTPVQYLEQPEGLVTVRIDPATGRLAGADHPDAVFETFRRAQVPTAVAEATPRAVTTPEDSGSGVTERLF